MLSLWHTHGSAPRSSYPVCQFLARRKRLELDRKTTRPQKRKRGRRASIGFVVGVFGNISFFVGSGTQAYGRWGRIREKRGILGSPLK